MKYASLSLKVAVAALFVVCLFPTLASAQAAFQGSVHFSNQVRWGQATLPAGDYTITISSGHTPSFATIRSLDGRLSIMVLAGAFGDATPGHASLLVARFHNERVAVSLNLPQLGRSFRYAELPTQPRDRSLVANPESLPVVAK